MADVAGPPLAPPFLPGAPQGERPHPGGWGKQTHRQRMQFCEKVYFIGSDTELPEKPAAGLAHGPQAHAGPPGAAPWRAQSWLRQLAAGHPVGGDRRHSPHGRARGRQVPLQRRPVLPSRPRRSHATSVHSDSPGLAWVVWDTVPTTAAEAMTNQDHSLLLLRPGPWLPGPPQARTEAGPAQAARSDCCLTALDVELAAWRELQQAQASCHPLSRASSGLTPAPQSVQTQWW